MVIRALDHVAQCYTAKDGMVINRVLRKQLARESQVKLSFDGVTDVPSSFVNTSIVALLDTYSGDYIKQHLTISDATRQIGEMVRRCLANGLNRQQEVVPR